GAEIVIPESQQLVQLCIDKDVLDCFRKKSEDYFTHINAVLRDYIQAHQL
ncbi:BrnA antitoxin family protein, partial [bacterium]|nr:BrnA antitoxin family protein [bacterium]